GVYVDCDYETSQYVASKRSKNTNDYMFEENKLQIVEFVCDSNDTDLCGKARNAFEIAGLIITKAFIFHIPVLVNVSFTNFCKTLNVCGDEAPIGGAKSARHILMRDDDGIDRLYPQALVKQYKLQPHPQFAPYDIKADFNSAASWWFKSDGKPIQGQQKDLVEIILHEYFHGLGFKSNWDDWTDPQTSLQALSPLPLFRLDSQNSSSLIFDGFKESAFDKYLILRSSGQNISEFNTQLNFFAGGPGAKFQNKTNFENQFYNSTQYNQIAKPMFINAQTAKSLGFLPHNKKTKKKAVILETSLIPYSRGSSISHVDLKTYENTSDFLMKYSINLLDTLDGDVAKGGNFSGGPIGPLLRSIMETLGPTLIT
ncbi:9229_t:CDS:2, partial [Dentiscutata erythropus]